MSVIHFVLDWGAVGAVAALTWTVLMTLIEAAIEASKRLWGAIFKKNDTKVEEDHEDKTRDDW